MEIYVALVLAIAILLFFFINWKKKQPRFVVTDSHRKILAESVSFYQFLSNEKKVEFEQRIQDFLSSIRITGVKTIVEDMDRILIAASAIIPIFNFRDWQYTNLHEVLVYPDNFGEKFQQEGGDRNILGMVGWGAMQNVMIISKTDLRRSFSDAAGKTNTAIHEFVHLLDKTDGAIDGIPENIMKQQYVLPWLDMMRKSINEIQKGRSDINPYGATNQAEFFAVVSEYFFERPDLLKERHPELFQMLEEIYHSRSNAGR